MENVVSANSLRKPKSIIQMCASVVFLAVSWDNRNCIGHSTTQNIHLSIGCTRRNPQRGLSFDLSNNRTILKILSASFVRVSNKETMLSAFYRLQT